LSKSLLADAPADPEAANEGTHGDDDEQEATNTRITVKEIKMPNSAPEPLAPELGLVCAIRALGPPSAMRKSLKDIVERVGKGRNVLPWETGM
jgi:hypothetical protein